ncbi:STAS domain-containing protein [Ancylobacter sp. A5.8]|uniref:STAS domain-containing protein n=1 Tax=Ancylobacter gelatini TaxID=2919920 RepID=UPI001F4DEA7D|nr:STAS domain-containing protein [Ancylobacter gelatini]MCJ8143594.1 STAS domain-containing protein [Ancylobacter gelatini]
MQIDRSIENAVMITTVKGRLDSSSAQRLDEVLAVIPEGSNGVLLDFAELVFISSAGLRVVLKAAKLARGASIPLAVCSLSPQVHEVFEVSGFSALIPIHQSRETALVALT